jgi:hypothetical protein
MFMTVAFLGRAKGLDGRAISYEFVRGITFKHGQDLPYTSGEFSGLVSKCLDN